MRNLLIITPYYPFPKKKRLIQDTKAIYYLCSNRKEDERIIILYYYQHTRVRALRALLRLIVKKPSDEQCIFQDDRGNTVFLFEHPCIIPHGYKTMKWFDERYSKFLNGYLSKNNIEIDSIVVHFPIRFSPIAEKIKSKKRVAVLHSFDVEKAERHPTLSVYLERYDKVGYRSKQIMTMSEQLHNKSSFWCLSGVPDELTIERKRRNWKEDGILQLVFVGKLNKNKNAKTILYALKHIGESVNWKLTIIGDGEERKEIEDLVKAYEINNKVEMLGSITRDEVIEYLKNKDIFVLLSYKETLGLAYLEALATGNIVIGSKGRGIDGIITDGKEGFLIEPSDSEALSNTIMKIDALSPEDVEKIRMAGYNLVSTMTESLLSRKYLEETLY